MAQLTIDKIKDLDIPINVSRKKNNLLPASRSVVLYNDSVNLYDAIKLVSTDLITSIVTTPTEEQIQDVVGSMFVDSSTINFTYDDALNTITAVTIPTAIDHDLLLNFVANEHIDHTSVSILSGTGLTGGGNLTTTRTLSLANTTVVPDSYGSASAVASFTVDSQGRLTAAADIPIIIEPAQVNDLTEYIQDALSSTLVAGSNISLSYNDVSNSLTINSTSTPYSDEMAQDAVGAALQDTSTINFTYNDASNIITADIIIGAIDHDLLLNFVSNEHIDHSTVSIIAGTGLNGGGNLTASRTLNITDTGVVAASYGDASTISTFTVNAQGQLTAASSATVLIGANQVSNFSEAVDDRVAALLVAGTNITLTYNDASNTLTIAAPSSGGGSVGGTGSAYQVAHWSSSSNIAGDANFLWDGTSLAVNQNSIPLNSILSTTGTTTSFLFSGYTHHDSTGTPVFRVADDGSIHMGAGLDPLVASDAGLSKESGFTLQSSTGNIHLYPQTAGAFVYVQSAMAINTATIGSDKFRVEGQTRINLGSDATGDLLVRGPSGNLVRLPVGSSSEVLGVVSGTPA